MDRLVISPYSEENIQYFTIKINFNYSVFCIINISRCDAWYHSSHFVSMRRKPRNCKEAGPKLYLLISW